MRKRMVCVLALWVSMACGFRCFAALTPEEKTAVAEVKAGIKTALANFKTNNAGDLATFNSDIDAAVANVEDGSIPAVLAILLALEDATTEAMLAFYQNGLNAVGSAAAASGSAYALNNVESPAGCRPGDGGQWEKLRITMEKEFAKLRKAIGTKLRAASKSIRAASSGNIGVNFVVLPIRYSLHAVFNQASALDAPQFDQMLCVVLGASDASSSNSAVAIAGGISESNVFVTLGTATDAVAIPSGGRWVFANGGLAAQNWLLVVKSAADATHDIGKEAIGTAP